MQITDAQVHIWKANTPERPWLAGQEAHRAKPLEVDELLTEMDGAGVSRVVIVPPTLDADRNDLALDAARRYPDRFAVMGRLNLDLPGAREKIPGWKNQPGMLGLRFSGRSARSGEAISRASIARTASALRCSPRKCPGSRAGISNGSWAGD